MRKTDRYYYPAICSYEDNGIAVEFPDLNCATCGDTDEDAFVSARELLGCVLLGLEEDGIDVPPASKLSDIKLKDGEYTILVDVFMPSIRCASKTKSVNRTVTLPAWLNETAKAKKINFSQALQEVLKEMIR